MQITPTYGVSSQAEVNLDARLPEDPLKFATDASKAGLYVQYFMRDGKLWARVAGGHDEVQDFVTSLP